MNNPFSLISKCRKIRNRSDADAKHKTKWDRVLIALGDDETHRIKGYPPMTAAEAKGWADTPGQNKIWKEVYRELRELEEAEARQTAEDLLHDTSSDTSDGSRPEVSSTQDIESPASSREDYTLTTEYKPQKPKTELERLREENTYLHNNSNVAALERKLHAKTRLINQWQAKYADLEKRLTSNTLAADYQRAQDRIAQMQRQLADLPRLTNIETEYQKIKHEYRELSMRLDPEGKVMDWCQEHRGISRDHTIDKDEVIITLRDATLPPTAFARYHTCSNCGMSVEKTLFTKKKN